MARAGTIAGRRTPWTGPCTLTPVAETGDRFGDFAPYVASIDDRGIVAFQAALRGGRTGVFHSDGTSILEVADAARHVHVRSHPDIGGAGATSFYADLAPGGQAVLLIRDGRIITIAGTGGAFESIGPLGPTMNDAGTVAFRADTGSGTSGLFTGSGAEITTIAETGGLFRGFQGLPVVDRRGTVVFRADLTEGGQAIYAYDGGALTPLADTRRRFASLGAFPCSDDEGTVVFAAALAGGAAGVFTAKGGEITTIADTSGPFESFRGALIDGAGAVVLLATPRGGALGIYAGPDPATQKILSIGDPCLGSTVTSFALNPVSINRAGQLAIRVSLAGDRQAILRADPA